MAKSSEFPWDVLKAECLRLVCSQLIHSTGTTHTGIGRREDMIEFLNDVEARGLEPAVKKLERTARTTAAQKSTAVEKITSPAKRKSARLEGGAGGDSDNEEGYNTRYKGMKRVKVRQETPERKPRSPRKRSRRSISERRSSVSVKRSPRKSVGSASAGPAKRGRGRPRKSVPEDADDDDEHEDKEVKRGRGRARKSDVSSGPKRAAAKAGETQKRGRGRPRKSVNGEANAPTSKGKEVFVGVVMEKRISSKNDNEDAEGEEDGEGEEVTGEGEEVTGEGEEENAEGEEENAEGEEEDAVLATVNGTGQIHDGTSSLGGSNKENDPGETSKYTPEAEAQDVDMDAPGEPDPEAQAVFPLPTTTAT